MKCSDCGARISNRAKFCSRCGVANLTPALPKEPEGELKAYAKDLVAEGGVALGELKDAAVKGLKSDAGKSILVWGAFGAVAGAALPFVTPLIVGALGAGYGALRKL